ncbi:Isochorismatase hydrolase [Naematelia encephala]|uniref:Isochorismatase hydrolase n=1 Tax=Naematelia encephala TaxID=71784 RepID=A0A1Y2BJI4_9TREE|nr:Isochorismatase hydrolase [Naematelia encephala]
MPRIDPKSTVLLICDVQERFRSAIFGFDAMVGTISKMVKAAQLLEIPVITTEQNPRALGSTIPELGLSSLPPNLDLGTFSKTRFSMTIPSITSILQERSVKWAIIVGIESHVCVLQTALSLLETDTKPYILADGVSSCNRQEIPVALERMRHDGVTITTSESILFQLVDDASSPLFKPFANLIKESKESTKTALSTLLDRQTNHL